MSAGAFPRVTIGLPVYNGERFVAASLDATRAQTFSDFELIISDNASTDGTEEICREYPRRRDHFSIRLVGEYLLGYVTAIRRAPLSIADRCRCYLYLLEWLGRRSILKASGRSA